MSNTRAAIAHDLGMLTGLAAGLRGQQLCFERMRRVDPSGAAQLDVAIEKLKESIGHLNEGTESLRGGGVS
jgi:hypothetical protein